MLLFCSPSSSVVVGFGKCHLCICVRSHLDCVGSDRNTIRAPLFAKGDGYVGSGKGASSQLGEERGEGGA